MLFPVTDHERRVAAMMLGFGQHVPACPVIPSQEIRAARVAFLLEEVLEFAEESAIDVCIMHDGEWVTLTQQRGYISDLVAPDGTYALVNIEGREPSLVGMIDALADISVVNTGAFIACGVRMTPVLECVDANNMLKVATGKLDPISGKFVKAPDHPKPNFAYELKLQGYQEEFIHAG